MKLINESGITDDVIFTDYIQDDHLLFLYNTADVFVYPSFFWRFWISCTWSYGLRNPGSHEQCIIFPEVVGDAGLMCDPNSPEEIADNISRVLTDQSLREHLRIAGIKKG